MGSRSDQRARPAARVVRDVLGSEDGVALVLGLITIVIMLLITVALVVAAVTETLSSQVHEDSGRALNVAEAGAAHAIAYALRFDRNWSDATEATAGNCGSVTIQGTTWQILRDTTRDICLENVAYPGSAPVDVRPTTGGGGVAGAACSSSFVDVATGGGGSGSSTGTAVQQIGTYTVLFHPTQDRTDGTLTVRVIATVKRAARGVEFLARRITPADFVAYSANTVDSVNSGAGTFDINGSIYIRGNWGFKGSSTQTNGRPVTTADADATPYENQTFVCNNLSMIGNAQIGEPSRPMRAVHVAGSVTQTGSAAIYTNRMDKAVPDVRLGDVLRLTKCIKGLVDGTLAPPINQTNCEDEFGTDIWDSYTNHLDGTSLRARRIRYTDSASGSWVPEDIPSALVFDGTRFALPKRNQEGACGAALTANRPLKEVLGVCSLYYDGPNGHLYVAGRQVIYLPGSVRIDNNIRYRVDDEPDGGEQTQRDASVIVVACEDCTGTGDSLLVNRRRFLAWNRGSEDLYFANRDLLAFLVNGAVKIEGQGTTGNCVTRSDQEVNAAFVVGGDPGTLVAVYRVQLFGSLMAKRLVLDSTPSAYNFQWCQVPDLKEVVGTTVLGRFLNDPRSSTVIMQNWREVGF